MQRSTNSTVRAKIVAAFERKRDVSDPAKTYEMPGLDKAHQTGEIIDLSLKRQVCCVNRTLFYKDIRLACRMKDVAYSNVHREHHVGTQELERN